MTFPAELGNEVYVNTVILNNAKQSEESTLPDNDGFFAEFTLSEAKCSE